METELAMDNLGFEPQAVSDLEFLTLGDFDMSVERFLPADSGFVTDRPRPLGPYRGPGPKGPAHPLHKGDRKAMNKGNRRGRNLKHGGHHSMWNKHNNDIGDYKGFKYSKNTAHLLGQLKRISREGLMKIAVAIEYVCLIIF